MRCLKLAIAVALLALGQCYPNFQNSIPNGDRVPHPCPQMTGGVWNGVGHENPGGAGVRNPFGKDFERNGLIWNDCLCMTDSDGDGKTNGEELGDPECKWMPGDIPDMEAGSHPGVCEPMDASECRDKNAWLQCDSMVPFECPAFDEPDTRSVELTINRTPVPPQDTFYLCKAIQFPAEVANGDFHMIGASTIIDNADILHHLIVYGCPDEATDIMMSEYGTERECGEMVTEKCNQIVYIWAFGTDPKCFGDDFGVRIGQNGFKTLVFEFHWNNPLERDDQFDASGVHFYYTPNLRQYDADVVFFGKIYLELPPGRPMVEQESTCPGVCTTNMFQETVYISTINPHMHMLGRKMLVEHKRDGMVIATLMEENNFDYNQPTGYTFNPPIEFRPGDEMRVVCTFDSTDADDFVFWGDATRDEMCIAMTQYYPKQANAASCMGYDDLTGVCPKPYQPDVPMNSTDDDDDDGNYMFYGSEYLNECYANFATDESSAAYGARYYGYMAQLRDNCDWSGRTCFENCPEVLNMILMDECFVAPNFHKIVLMPLFIETVLDPLQFSIDSAIRALASCDETYTSASGSDQAGHNHDNDSGALCPTYMPPLPPSGAPRTMTASTILFFAVAMMMVMVL